MNQIPYFVIGSIIMLQTACTGLFYHPSKTLHITPADAGLAYEDVRISNTSSPELHAWFLPAKKEAFGTVLHLHGNAENMSNHLGGVYWLPSKGFNVMLLDYQGYGQSEGSPSPANTVKDVVLAYEHLANRADIDLSKVILFGQSLGGSIALYVAARELKNKFRAVVAESPFAGYRLIAKDKLKEAGLPGFFASAMSYLVIDSYSPILTVEQIAPTPLLLVHPRNDSIVPFHHSQLLFDKAKEPKGLWKISQVDHIETFGDSKQRDRLVKYLKQTLNLDHSDN
jgi:hypothetical protein